MKPIDQLKSVLAESGYDVINEANYNAGYYKGGTDQAFEDGKKLGEILNKQNKQ